MYYWYCAIPNNVRSEKSELISCSPTILILYHIILAGSSFLVIAATKSFLLPTPPAQRVCPCSQLVLGEWEVDIHILMLGYFISNLPAR